MVARRESTEKVEIVHFRGMIRTVTHANTHVLAASNVTDDIRDGSQNCITMLCVGEFRIGEEVLSRSSKIL